jgi:hypothetical protein
MNTVIEINNSDVIVHGEYATFEDAENAVRNVKRRVGVVGEVFAATMFEEVEENLQNVTYFDDAEYGYVTFAEASRILGVRYQQVYQRAVTKAKMSWQQTTAMFVSLKDVEIWQEQRKNRAEKE